MTLSKLDDSEIAGLCALLPLWSLDSGKLKRSLQFANFVDAFAFMSAVAQVAHRLDHHPEWRNVYDTVEIALQTHDVAGLSRLDQVLAAEIDTLATRFGAA